MRPCQDSRLKKQDEKTIQAFENKAVENIMEESEVQRTDVHINGARKKLLAYTKTRNYILVILQDRITRQYQEQHDYGSRGWGVLGTEDEGG